MSAERNEQVGRAYFDLLGRGDVAGALAMMTEDATWTVAGRPADFPLAGSYDREGFTRMLGRIGSVMPDGVRVTITSVTADDERVVIEADVRGTSVAHKEYDNRLVYVFDMRDGRIAAAREYLDTIHAGDVLVA